MLQQLLTGGRFRKNPVVQLEREKLVPEIPFKHTTLTSFKQYLLRSKVIQQLVYIVERTFGRKELSGRNIQEGHATGTFSEMYGSKKIILPIVQHVVVDRYARSYQLRDSPLHQLLGQFRVFQLVANRHPLAGTNQLGQIGVECMVGKSGHLNGLPLAIGTLGQRNTQYLRSNNGIGRISFIEVPATKQHHSIGMLRLQVEKLFHHRSKDNIFLHDMFF